MLNQQPQQDNNLPRKGVPDDLLIEQVLAGNQCAFEFLVNRYHYQLVSHIRGILKDNDQVSDVLQHVYLQLYRWLPTLSAERPLKGWLLQVARNRCLDELRQRRRRAEVPFSTLPEEDGEEELSLLEAIADPEPLPEELIERLERHRALHMAISSLPQRSRSIVHLRCFGQMTFAEIGQTLNMPTITVKTCFYRSLPLLRGTLASNEQFPSIS